MYSDWLAIQILSDVLSPSFTYCWLVKKKRKEKTLSTYENYWHLLSFCGVKSVTCFYDKPRAHSEGERFFVKDRLKQPLCE